jgi:tetratricopeptide (TPR) repeat protein
MRARTRWLLALLLPSLAGAAEPYTYVHHPVSTERPAAQEAFDRGLTLIYAYSRDEAESSFRLAARLDPGMAMAWWGVALALGPDINNQPKVDRTLKAAEALAHAGKLAETRATSAERAYITALAQRYSSDAKPDFDTLAIRYRDAMRELAARDPADADAAALLAEALMDLHAWQLWTNEGQPAPGTVELVQVIEEHLQRSPDHIGLLHFHIHALEASPNPERALASARRLAAFPMEPAAAHLIHMPAHIYLRVGDWAAAIKANHHSTHQALDYRRSGKPNEPFACGHCQDFLRHAYDMAGNLAGARSAAQQYQQLTKDPTALLGVLARFGQWDELLTTPEPASAGNDDYLDPNFAQGIWHYARGVALAATGRTDRVAGELAALRTAAGKLPAPYVVAPGALNIEHGLDDLQRRANLTGLALAEQILSARSAQAQGDMPGAIRSWQAAVELQDHIVYSEPPVWYYPVRESLGAALLRAGSAAQAETVFREDLRRNPNNPRSVFGLAATLKAQRKQADAAATAARFKELWALADVPLALADL